ncbi:uncharacterized protein TNCV_1571261 [Trichonephila clavipes]|uniref:Transposase Tc1-like domain-containing protein n=1 Tax=Trichonephila clavipes TaxID=2585209 RepID=A0A8X6SPZ1_TRICX|nr:uncharacterized protein TNCV_1571261 [Trichonephila clavipes]
MSRSRLPDSLKWRSVEWMEIKIRHVSCRPRATTPAHRFLHLWARRRRTTTVSQLVEDFFVASGRRISATMVRRRLHNANLYAGKPVACIPFHWMTEKAPLIMNKRTCFLNQTAMGILYSSQDSPDSHWRANQSVC